MSGLKPASGHGDACLRKRRPDRCRLERSSISGRVSNGGFAFIRLVVASAASPGLAFIRVAPARGQSLVERPSRPGAAGLHLLSGGKPATDTPRGGTCQVETGVSLPPEASTLDPAKDGHTGRSRLGQSNQSPLALAPLRSYDHTYCGIRTRVGHHQPSQILPGQVEAVTG